MPRVRIPECLEKSPDASHQGFSRVSPPWGRAAPDFRFPNETFAAGGSRIPSAREVETAGGPLGEAAKMVGRRNAVVPSLDYKPGNAPSNRQP